MADDESMVSFKVISQANPGVWVSAAMTLQKLRFKRTRIPSSSGEDSQRFGGWETQEQSSGADHKGEQGVTSELTMRMTCETGETGDPRRVPSIDDVELVYALDSQLRPMSVESVAFASQREPEGKI